MKMPASNAMMPMATSSSIIVNACGEYCRRGAKRGIGRGLLGSGELFAVSTGIRGRSPAQTQENGSSCGGGAGLITVEVVIPCEILPVRAGGEEETGASARGHANQQVLV